jgi:hypothetical protein
LRDGYPELRERMRLIKQATGLIVEEALDGEAGDAIA